MDLLLSEAARLLDKSESQVRYMIKSGRLKASKVDGRWRIQRWRREIGEWLLEKRLLALNTGKGHVRSTACAQTYLGYRISQQGWDLGPKAMRRFRRRLPRLASGDLGRLERSLAAWRGVMMV